MSTDDLLWKWKDVGMDIRKRFARSIWHSPFIHHDTIVIKLHLSYIKGLWVYPKLTSHTFYDFGKYIFNANFRRDSDLVWRIYRWVHCRERIHPWTKYRFSVIRLIPIQNLYFIVVIAEKGLFRLPERHGVSSCEGRFALLWIRVPISGHSAGNDVQTGKRNGSRATITPLLHS